MENNNQSNQPNYGDSYNQQENNSYGNSNNTQQNFNNNQSNNNPPNEPTYISAGAAGSYDKSTQNYGGTFKQDRGVGCNPTFCGGCLLVFIILGAVLYFGFGIGIPFVSFILDLI